MYIRRLDEEAREALSMTPNGIRILGGPGGLALGSLLLALCLTSFGMRTVSSAVSRPVIQIDVPSSKDTVVTGLNDANQVVGFSIDNSGKWRGFVLTQGVFSTVPVPGPTLREAAFGINNGGRVVGAYSDARGAHGFVQNGSAFSTIDFPGAVQTLAHGINDRGDIVGWYDDGRRHGFVLAGGSFSPINVPSATGTEAMGINAKGDIVGYFTDPSRREHGFLLSAGTFRTIDIAGAAGTELLGINNSSQIVGYSVDTSGKEHAFEFDGGALTPIDVPNAAGVEAAGINSNGQIAGGYQDGAKRQHGFIRL